MVMDVFPVCVGGDNKSIFSLGKAHCQFIANLVGFFGGDLTRFERLTNLVGNHITFLSASSDKFVLPFGQHKFLIDR